MRNQTISIIIIVSIMLLAYSMFHGTKIGNLEILSISQIKEKNSELDTKIKQVSSLTSIDYPAKVENLEKTFEKFTIKKETYEELTGETIENIEEIYETKQYDISYLWRVLGNYAENRKLTLGMDVQNANADNNLYNLNFTISGRYVDIIKFITDIENDSDFNFRIYNFKISGSEVVTATFIVKDINIDSSTIKNTQTNFLELSNKVN